MTNSDHAHPFPGQVLRHSENLDTYKKDFPRPEKVSDLNHANIVTSETDGSSWLGGMHKPVLDLDFPCKLVPSSTPGHFHLYMDCDLSWPQYKKLLTVLAEVGIIETGYLQASIERGYTAVRLPWIKKLGVDSTNVPRDGVTFVYESEIVSGF